MYSLMQLLLIQFINRMEGECQPWLSSGYSEH